LPEFSFAGVFATGLSVTVLVAARIAGEAEAGALDGAGADADAVRGGAAGAGAEAAVLTVVLARPLGRLDFVEAA
jgi:hypothetical protein